MSAEFRPTATLIVLPVMEQRGFVPKRSTEAVEKSWLQPRDGATGRDDDEIMDTTLKELSHSTDVKLNSPNCTNGWDTEKFPVTLMLMTRPMAEAATKQIISLGDT